MNCDRCRKQTDELIEVDGNAVKVAKNRGNEGILSKWFFKMLCRKCFNWFCTAAAGGE